jgi:hypothetical protein
MGNITHLFLGLTNEWLDSACGAGKPDEAAKVPIIVKGKVERHTLSKLSKLLVAAMPNASRVKILKMSKKATIKQYLTNMKQ